MHIVITMTDIIKRFEAELMALRNSLNTKNKLDDNEVKDLLALAEGIKELKRLAICNDRMAGLSGKEVAERYGVTPGRVTQIVNEMVKSAESSHG